MICNLRHPMSLGHPAFQLGVHLFVFHHFDTHIKFAVKYCRMFPWKKWTLRPSFLINSLRRHVRFAAKVSNRWSDAHYEQCTEPTHKVIHFSPHFHFARFISCWSCKSVVGCALWGDIRRVYSSCRYITHMSLHYTHVVTLHTFRHTFLALLRIKLLNRRCDED